MKFLIGCSSTMLLSNCSIQLQWCNWDRSIPWGSFRSMPNFDLLHRENCREDKHEIPRGICCLNFPDPFGKEVMDGSEKGAMPCIGCAPVPISMRACRLECTFSEYFPQCLVPSLTYPIPIPRLLFSNYGYRELLDWL